MTPKRYLVTGGSGFIGKALVRRLVRLGHHVRVLDNDSRGCSARLSDVKDDIEIVQADIRDFSAVRDAAKGMESVLHLAYVNGTEYFYSKPELVLDVGVRGMLAVLDACRANGIGELFLASSSEVYQTPPVVPTPEDVPLSVPDPLNPRYSYGGGKIICELMALNWGLTGFSRVVVFRPHNVIGPEMGFEHVLPQFAMRLHRLAATQPEGSLPFPIQGSGQETRAFIDVEDFTDGLVLLLEKGEHRTIYHIGRDREKSIREAAEAVARSFGRQIDITPGALKPGGTLRRCPDIGRMQALGFNPATPFQESVNRLVGWYRENAHLCPADKIL